MKPLISLAVLAAAAVALALATRGAQPTTACPYCGTACYRCHPQLDTRHLDAATPQHRKEPDA